MTTNSPAGLRILRSGWIPAFLVGVMVVGALHRGAHVGYRDIAAFAGYLAGWIVLPGTLAWRFVQRNAGQRPLAESLAIGALVGYVLEFPVYLTCLAVGAPRLYLAWPVLVLAITLGTPAGRRLWQPTGIRMPLGWSWTVAGVLAYLVAWFGHNIWGPNNDTTFALRRPYIDEPFHLSLATSLKHFFPPTTTYVADTPLDYHWLSHLHVAAASWITGTEPVVILRSLGIPIMFLILAVALAHCATRLTGAHWPGLFAVAALLIGPMDFSGWVPGSKESLLAMRLLDSPSAGFVNAALLVGVLLCIELLRGRLKGPWPWLLVTLTFVAMIGAKSTSLPTVMAGLFAAAAVSIAVTRRWQPVPAGLAVLSAVAFFVGKDAFFGPGNHGLVFSPLTLTNRTGDLSTLGALLAAGVYLAYLTTGAGLIALLTRKGWREPDRIFLAGTVLAGFGAALSFHQNSFSEYYFLYVVLLPMILGGALGLHHVAQHLAGRIAVRYGVAATVVGLGIGLLLAAIGPDIALRRQDMAGTVGVLKFTVLPMLALLLAIAVTAVVIALVARRAVPALRIAAVLPLLLILASAGVGLSFTARQVPDLVSDPWGTSIKPHGSLIGSGGIKAARWLRAHSGQQDLIATNAHCQTPVLVDCAERNFWMAGYTERQMLVEGWSYVSRSSVGLDPTGEDSTRGAFWDPTRLAENDAAFTDPSPTTLGRLRTKYGVTWLLVDRRYPVDLAGLRKLADRRYRDGVYTVFRLR